MHFTVQQLVVHFNFLLLWEERGKEKGDTVLKEKRIELLPPEHGLTASHEEKKKKESFKMS